MYGVPEESLLPIVDQGNPWGFWWWYQAWQQRNPRNKDSHGILCPQGFLRILPCYQMCLSGSGLPFPLVHFLGKPIQGKKRKHCNKQRRKEEGKHWKQGKTKSKRKRKWRCQVSAGEFSHLLQSNLLLQKEMYSLVFLIITFLISWGFVIWIHELSVLSHFTL